MSASNLFDDLEGDDDIFYTPAKTPPKKKKQWMDDLLDDDKDLFGGITVDKKETVAVVAAGKETLEETEAKKPKSGGGLFDDLPLDDGGDAPLSTSDGQASNGVNGYKDEEFVVVSHDEVPSQEEAERTANPPPDTDTTEAEHDGPNSDLFNQNVGYEERARIRREQRRKRAQEKEHSSKTPSPTSPPLDDTKQDRDKRSTTPSPSPGIEETTQIFSGSSKSQSPIPVEPRVEKADSSTPTPEPPAQQPKDDSSEQIWQLTKSLERAQSENGYLKSENERLSGQVKTLQEKVAQLEKQLADRDKKEEVDSADNKKQVANLQEQLKSKDKEIEELKAVLKKSESPHHASVTTVVSVKKTPNSPRTKLRAGVDKGRPITSVADSVKKFGGAGATEVKRTPVPPKPKSSPAHVKPDDKHTTAKKPSVPFHSKPSPPSKPRATVHHDKPDAHPSKHSHAHHSHPSAKDHTHHPHPHHTPHAHHPHPHPHPHKPEPANRSAKVTHKKPHPHHHAHSHTTTSDKKESEKQDKKMEEGKKTEEVTVTKEEPKPEPEPVAPPADAEPPSEPKPEAPAAEVKPSPSEKKEEETTIQQLEKDTTRAQRVISLFENKGTSKPEQEQAPTWKVNAQQQRTAKEKEEREKEEARQKEQEQEEKEKQEAEEKSRTSSNASSQKDEPVIVNGSVENTTAESANDEKEETDGGIITKPKTVASTSSNVTKSTSALPPATKNTSNKNEDIKIRDNKMKKTGSASTIPDPKKRLMVDEAKGKRTSWAAPKREECAVCNKVVYVMERLEADKVVYHKTCFKCTVCNKTLSTGTYAALQGKTYCKVHFKQLFKMKGNYDEGFGREQHKTKWIKKDGETEA